MTCSYLCVHKYMNGLRLWLCLCSSEAVSPLQGIICIAQGQMQQQVKLTAVLCPLDDL